MKRPAVFFDRDNTLIISNGYLGDPALVRLMPGAADAVARARSLGFATVVISNQSGVARGLFDEDAVRAVNERVDEMLRQQNPAAVIDRHEFCPFHPDATVPEYRQESELRKPRPGMLVKAAEGLALDLSRSWMVGDAPRDVEAGHAAGCRTVLFQAPDLAPSAATEANPEVEADYVVSTLREALDFIERNRGKGGVDDAADAADAEEGAGPEAEAAAADGAPGGAGASARSGAMSLAPAPAVAAPDPSAPRPPSSSPAPAVPTSPSASAVHTAGPSRASTARPAQAPAGAAPAARAKAPVPARPARSASGSGPAPSSRLESLAEQILHEMRRRNEQIHTDFSASKLLAGIVQVIVLAVLFLAYLKANSAGAVQTCLLLALTLQTLTIALLIMGKQK